VANSTGWWTKSSRVDPGGRSQGSPPWWSPSFWNCDLRRGDRGSARVYETALDGCHPRSAPHDLIFGDAFQRNNQYPAAIDLCAGVCAGDRVAAAAGDRADRAADQADVAGAVLVGDRRAGSMASRSPCTVSGRRFTSRDAGAHDGGRKVLSRFHIDRLPQMLHVRGQMSMWSAGGAVRLRGAAGGSAAVLPAPAVGEAG